MKRIKCTCGRSPTGFCNGWHSLSSEQYEKRRSKHSVSVTGDIQEQNLIKKQVKAMGGSQRPGGFSLDLNHIESLIASNFVKS